MPTRFNAAAYIEWIDDAQRAVYAFVGGQLGALVANVPHTKIKGIELDGQINPQRWLTLGGTLNHTDAKFGSEPVNIPGSISGPVAFGPYPDTPEWSGSVFGEINAPISKTLAASFRADFYFQTTQYTGSLANTLTPGAFIPSYDLTNFRLSIEDEKAGWTLSAILKNAFDNVYYVGGIAASNLFGFNLITPGDRRTITIDARLTF